MPQRRSSMSPTLDRSLLNWRILNQKIRCARCQDNRARRRRARSQKQIRRRVVVLRLFRRNNADGDTHGLDYRSSGKFGESPAPAAHRFNTIGVDFHEPSPSSPKYDFYQLDLGQESSCAKIAALLIARRVQCVLHLAFVLDPLRTGVLDLDRMWRINVAGTARILEAIAEANRMGGSVL